MKACQRSCFINGTQTTAGPSTTRRQHPSTCANVVDDAVAVSVTHIHQLLAGGSQAPPVAAPAATRHRGAAAAAAARPAQSP